MVNNPLCVCAVHPFRSHFYGPIQETVYRVGPYCTLDLPEILCRLKNRELVVLTVYWCFTFLRPNRENVTLNMWKKKLYTRVL